MTELIPASGYRFGHPEYVDKVLIVFCGYIPRRSLRGDTVYIPDVLFDVLSFIFGVFPPGIDGIFPFIRRFLPFLRFPGRPTVKHPNNAVPYMPHIFHAGVQCRMMRKGATP
jgi:hypothetical protein